MVQCYSKFRDNFRLVSQNGNLNWPIPGETIAVQLGLRDRRQNNSHAKSLLVVEHISTVFSIDMMPDAVAKLCMSLDASDYGAGYLCEKLSLSAPYYWASA